MIGIAPGLRVLDAGCGSGHNLVYFLRAGYDCSAWIWIRRRFSTRAASLQFTRRIFLWRVLKPGGRLPDGSERYLVDEALLLRLTAELGGQLADPLKTTIVQNQRCMSTWVARKDA